MRALADDEDGFLVSSTTTTTSTTSGGRRINMAVEEMASWSSDEDMERTLRLRELQKRSDHDYC